MISYEMVKVDAYPCLGGWTVQVRTRGAVSASEVSWCTLGPFLIDKELSSLESVLDAIAEILSNIWD